MRSVRRKFELRIWRVLPRHDIGAAKAIVQLKHHEYVIIRILNLAKSQRCSALPIDVEDLQSDDLAAKQDLSASSSKMLYTRPFEHYC